MANHLTLLRSGTREWQGDERETREIGQDEEEMLATWYKLCMRWIFSVAIYIIRWCEAGFKEEISRTLLNYSIAQEIEFMHNAKTLNHMDFWLNIDVRLTSYCGVSRLPSSGMINVQTDWKINFPETKNLTNQFSPVCNKSWSVKDHLWLPA